MEHEAFAGKLPDRRDWSGWLDWRYPVDDYKMDPLGLALSAARLGRLGGDHLLGTRPNTLHGRRLFSRDAATAQTPINDAHWTSSTRASHDTC